MSDGLAEGIAPPPIMASIYAIIAGFIGGIPPIPGKPPIPPIPPIPGGIPPAPPIIPIAALMFSGVIIDLIRSGFVSIARI